MGLSVVGAGQQHVMSNVEPTPEKPVEDWVTGDEPMTGPQRSYLETLAREAGEEVPDQLTKAEASQRIERLQQRTGRGDPEPSPGRGPAGPGSSEGSEDTVPTVDELIDQGIVDQQAAAEVSDRRTD